MRALYPQFQNLKP